MKRAVVICPGRGTYNKSELGYLGKHFPVSELLKQFDCQRSEAGQLTLTELDSADRFSVSVHTRGDNASGLIFASSLGDFLSICHSKVEVAAVVGNSMGWYTALGCAGALAAEDAFRVANTMGTLMQRSLIGGQLVYPFVDNDWVDRTDRRADLLALISTIAQAPDCELSVSIELGGMLVLAGNSTGLAAFCAAVEPVQQRYPMMLANHAAFHSPLVKEVSAQATALFANMQFRSPHIPMIDGRGAIWWPGPCDLTALSDYTFGAQVVEPFNFTAAITVAAREFAPDFFILVGPGNSLGGAIAQSLIRADWMGMTSKDDFVAKQSEDSFLISMGLENQRFIVC